MADKPHELATRVFKSEGFGWTLAWGDWEFGPDFDTEAEATSFLKFTYDALGLDPRHQSSATIARLYERWKRRGT